jgi:RNA polymerase sigma-70 factor, ECF subfamily
MTSDFTSVGFLRSLKNQSDAAWARLNDIYQPLVRKWLRSHGVRPTDADDVAQEVMLVVCRRLQDFQRQRTGSFRCWLRSITVNCLRDFRRKVSRQVAGEGVRELLLSLEDPNSSLSRLWDVEHDMHVLRYLMAELKDRFKKQTWLAFQGTAIAGRQPADVATELGMTENAVCIAKSRVSARIREAARGLL